MIYLNIYLKQFNLYNYFFRACEYCTNFLLIQKLLLSRKIQMGMVFAVKT